MKKIISIIALVLTALSVSAEENVYLQSCTVQQGGTATIKLIVAHDSSKGSIGSLQFNYSFPEGIEIADNGTDVVGVGATTVNAVTKFVLLGGLESTTSADVDAAQVCVFNISVPSTLSIGEHAMSISNVQAVYDDGVTDFKLDEVESTMTVQRAAIIDGLPEGYCLEVIPFQATEGNNNFNIMFKAPEIIKDLEFDITLPKGMFLYNSDYDNTLPTIVESALATNGTSVPTVTVTATDEQTAHVKVAGNKLKKTGMAAATDLVSAFTLTSYVFASGEMDETYDYVPNSIQTLKISNISMGNVAGTTTYSGKEYLASIYFGNPTETDPVVYGHYTSDTKEALKSLSPITVDMTAATIDEGVDPTDDIEGALIFEPDNTTAFGRTNNNHFGTVCLPFALTSDANNQYYALKSVTDSKIIFTEVDEVPANTPAIFSGNLKLSEDGYITPDAAGKVVATETIDYVLTGTYVSYELEDGAGYYITGDRFYGDGATVAPFRAYIAGLSSSVKSIAIEDETGIHDITSELSSEDVYNLQGIRMNKAQKGVNIIGGKKVYIKK